MFKKLLLVITLFIIAAVVVFSVSWFYYDYSTKRPNYSTGKIDTSEVDFVVKPGEKVYEIAQSLKDARLINSTTLFKIYVKLNNLSSKLQAGNYKIARNLNLTEVVSILQHGTFDVRLTIPEGWRREEIADYLSQAFNGQNPNYNSREFLAKTVKLEGFLFPDTYVVPSDIKSDDLIKLMAENFEKRVDNSIRSDFGKQKLNLEQVVVFASIVEREVSKDQDRPVVAGILIKRFREDWPLDADATVQYAVTSLNNPDNGKTWWPKNLTTDDLSISSSYNTRKNKGLPPTPIANPGIASIKAVVYPLETPYWFYLTGKDGVTYYAKTLEEHLSNVTKFLP